MKPILLLAAASLVFLSRAFADAPDFVRLKQNYEAAIKRVEEPIKTTYERELQHLLEMYTKSGNLDAATQVSTELQDMHKASAAAAGAAAPAPGKSTEHLFVGRTWADAGGTSFIFMKAGAGYRQYKTTKSAFIWHFTDNGQVEATGEAPGENKSQTFYFRFVNPIEAYFGTSPDALKEKLAPKR